MIGDAPSPGNADLNATSNSMTGALIQGQMRKS